MLWKGFNHEGTGVGAVSCSDGDSLPFQQLPDFVGNDVAHYYLCILRSGGKVGKNLPASAGDARDVGLIPGSRRSPGGGNGNVLQYSCLENPMDRGPWWATVDGVAEESDTT